MATIHLVVETFNSNKFGAFFYPSSRDQARLRLHGRIYLSSCGKDHKYMFVAFTVMMV